MVSGEVELILLGLTNSFIRCRICNKYLVRKGAIAMAMKCQDVLDKLQSSTFCTMSPGVRAAFDRHVESCSHCRSEVERFTESLKASRFSGGERSQGWHSCATA